MNNDTYSSLSITLSGSTQIGYGSDGVLYAVEDSSDGGETAYSIDTDSGSATEIGSDEVSEVDLGDIAIGPLQ